MFTWCVQTEEGGASPSMLGEFKPEKYLMRRYVSVTDPRTFEWWSGVLGAEVAGPFTTFSERVETEIPTRRAR